MPGLRRIALGFLLCTVSAACAQHVADRISDPANLMGERVSAPSPADTLAIDHGAPALEQLLLKLRTRASMMLIVAHPDDEDGGLLTFESRGQGARVAMLTLNRGEGGQNLMSADFNDALGLIRTQELLAEDRYTGVDQFFGTEVDFGFSKTKEESFDKWTHARVLYDAVRSVRLYRPLVLASVFVGGPTDGHGQHQVSGEIAQEVFTAAADPTVFPEMGLPPWTPLKVYARVPFSRVGPDGMFDYATGRTIPTLFHNYVTGAVSHVEPKATVLIHEGDPATISFAGRPATPALGMEGLSYVQFARKGLALQKSQIGADVRLAPAGKVDTGYTLMATRTGCPTSTEPAGEKFRGAPFCPTVPATEQSLFTGIDTSLPAMAALAPGAPASLAMELKAIDGNLAQAQSLFDPVNVAATAPPLHDALRDLDSLIHSVESYKIPANQRFDLLHELRVKRVQANDALALALGSAFSLRSQGAASALDGVSYPVALNLPSPSQPVALPLQRLWIDNSFDPIEPVAIPSGTTSRVVGASASARLTRHLTRPYFSRTDIETPYYTVSRPDLRNAPESPYALTVHAEFLYDGVPVELAAATVGRTSAQNAGAPVQFVPPFGIAFTNHAEIWPQDAPSFRVTLDFPHTTLADPDAQTLKRGTLILPATGTGPSRTGHISVSQPAGWPGLSIISVDALPAQASVTFGPAQDASSRSRPTSSMLLHASAKFDDDPGPSIFTESYRAVGYPGIPYTNLYTPATVRVTPLDMKVAPGLHVAYVPGTGDEVPAFLPSLGIDTTLLQPADLTPARLARFDAVMLGVRVYSAHPDLQGAGSKALNDFARAGGVVVAQYNSGGFDPLSAPYPYTVPGDSAHNVVEEADPVTLLKPDSPLLTWPNRIAAIDFSGWIEERGHGFASTWDPQYQALLETADPGQDPQRGGLLLAPVGKGAYIYCAYALYRQLPEAVPGAYRLLANLLSYSKNPNR
jgi:LmbE family N-acetylglucosaminyl deacetylase